MKEERIQILKMIENGQISVEEGATLLRAMEAGMRKERGEPSATPRAPAQPRWFRIRVTDAATGRQKVNVNIPLSLVNVGLRMGARFAPEMSGSDVERLMEAIRDGHIGKIIDVADDADGERVEIFVE